MKTSCVSISRRPLNFSQISPVFTKWDYFDLFPTRKNAGRRQVQSHEMALDFSKRTSARIYSQSLVAKTNQRNVGEILTRWIVTDVV
jgi:hypothetical protein